MPGAVAAAEKRTVKLKQTGSDKPLPVGVDTVALSHARTMSSMMHSWHLLPSGYCACEPGLQCRLLAG